MKKNVCRCSWSIGDPLYEAYHDTEWGVPVHDDNKHFEFLILEGAQAGLSWLTILKRRDGYRRAFANFEPEIVARFDNAKIEQLLLDPGIIRNRLKVVSTVENARRFLKIQEEFGSFDTYIWEFVGGQPIQNKWKSKDDLPCQSIESQLISKDLRKRGFNFVGPKIIYSHMQATGLVNDHFVDCFRYTKIRDSNP